MIGDKAREEMALSRGRKSLFPYVAIALKTPRKLTDDDDINSSDFYLIESPYLKYMPTARWSFRNYPYILMDTFCPNNNIRFKDWDDFIRRANEDTRWGEIFTFYLKYSNISKELLEIAKCNLRLPFYITFDFVKYTKDIGDKHFRTPSAERAERELYESYQRKHWMREDFSLDDY